MSRLEDFTLHTEYGSLKNDDEAVVTITVPASTVLAGAENKRYTQDVSVGSPFGLLDIMIRNNRSGPGVPENTAAANRYFMGGIQLIYTRTGKVDGSDTPYNARVDAYHISQTTVRCVVEIPNPYSTPMTTVNQNDIYTIDIKTLLLPNM